MNHEFRRGDIWLFDPDPTRGREQKKRRPCVILSVDVYNNGPADLLIILPLTTKKKTIPCHLEVKIDGLSQVSYIMCDQIRCISKERLVSTTAGKQGPMKLGSLSKQKLDEIERCLKVLLGFNRN